MLRSPIEYLERTDFLSNGSLNPELLSTPIFVMFQADYCHHCQVAKPAFQELANEGVIKCMTVQGDGEKQSERDIVPLLNTIFPAGFRGYPSYMLFMKNGRRVPYNGPRDTASLRRFVLSQ
jgi:thiol-disulfide isomerase/thioredoxin